MLPPKYKTSAMPLDDATMALSQTCVWLTELLARKLIAYLNTRAQNSLTANNLLHSARAYVGRTGRLREKQKWLKMKTLSVPDARIEFAVSWINWRLAGRGHQLHSKRISGNCTPRSTRYTRCRVPLQNLTVALRVSKLPAFYGTRSFITVFTTAGHYTLSWATSVEPHSSSHNIRTAGMSRFSKWSLTLTFAGQILHAWPL
jgi:hypothetical protein